MTAINLNAALDRAHDDNVKLRNEVERLRDEAGGVAMAAEQFGRQAESAKCEAEIERLRRVIRVHCEAIGHTETQINFILHPNN